MSRKPPQKKYRKSIVQNRSAEPLDEYIRGRRLKLRWSSLMLACTIAFIVWSNTQSATMPWFGAQSSDTPSAPSPQITTWPEADKQSANLATDAGRVTNDQQARQESADQQHPTSSERSAEKSLTSENLTMVVDAKTATHLHGTIAIL